MKTSFLLYISITFSVQICLSQSASPALVGYWQNWNAAAAPYLPLDQVDSRYNIVEVAFAIPHAGTTYQMEFLPEQISVQNFITKMQALQSQGKKVLISMGGGTAEVILDNTGQRDIFISSMTNIINTFGFDGIDIDFEGNSINSPGGTITAPTSGRIINLIYAIKQIMQNYQSAHGKKLMLTMAPETAYVQGGMSAYGGFWGAYLPVIHALRDSIDILQVQLYNSGSMYGTDGGVYSQGTADFIIAMTEAVITGFNTPGGFFAGLPANKIVVALPACTNAGGGFADTATVKAAMNYLRGTGPKPASYSLVQNGGYPSLRGMMTWSINWDAVSTCGTVYEFAQNFIKIFSSPGCVAASLNSFTSNVTGTAYQWQVNAGAGFANIANNGNYSGATAQTLTVTNALSSWVTNQYRCLVNNSFSNVFALRFTSTWTGSVNTAWENPANWACGAVPGTNTDVIIGGGSVVVNATTAVRTISVNNPSNITVASGANLKVLY